MTHGYDGRLPVPYGEQADHLGNIESFRTMSVTFADDLQPFALTIPMVEHAVQQSLPTSVPDNYTFINCTYNDILHLWHIFDTTVQRLGAPILIVGSEGDRDDGIVDPRSQVAIYGADFNPSDFYDSISRNNGIPGFKLLESSNYYHSAPPPSTIFDKTAQYSFAHSIEHFEQLEAHALPERYFMYWALRSGFENLHNPVVDEGHMQKLYTPTLERYDALRDSGHQALGLEEVYGIMSSSILQHLEENPELDFRVTPV